MRRWLMRIALLPVFLGRDLCRRLQGTGQDAVPLWQDEFAGGPVAVIALFQSGQIRPDTLAMILALRRLGVYVIAVNAGALASGGVRLPVDCYVERRNFGRDFGSYRHGLRLARRIAPGLTRAILLNDSVYVASRGLEPFLRRLLDSPADICSATESAELYPHQTSFCLSFSARCFSDAGFRRFWNRYRPTDLRPATVILGEIGLSRHLSGRGFSREVIASRSGVRDIVTSRPDLVLGGQGGRDPVQAADWCIAGNVTHRAPAALLELGVPLVKLDLARRGEIDDSGIAALSAGLDREDQLALAEILAARDGPAARAGALDRLGARFGLA
ncbi:hypothetical protein [Mangrovicoccus algicola]|uniref:Uncharacterized protein n=1 Tax=Mangrovicoccus algicola TaxID=2771008 RepID=A0A8J6YXU2_9RHOB|nr:hypothetical protein [Mangrovicoccus algicola]MBE3639712.1 hypothetical protein [Mangrovicoccus algicola]